MALTENLKKLSRVEFGRGPLSPVGDLTLTRGRELNVLVDQTCLTDSKRGPRSLSWLMELRASLIGTEARGMKSFVWKLDADWDFAELQNAFELEPCVSLVSPNGVFHLTQEIADPLVGKQEHFRALKYFEALPEFVEPLLVRKKVVIAVIDSGVDLKHPDLVMNKWTNANEVAGNGIDDDRNGYIDDENGYNFASNNSVVGPESDRPEANHGTHVAGLAASRFDNGVGGIGVNGVAKIMSLNIFGMNDSSRSVLLENAIRYAADNGADIINMSLGGREFSRTMRAALDYAVSRGSLLITAAGNYGIEICDDPDSYGFMSPGVYASSINGMMVTSSVDAYDGRLSSFSNFSSRLVEIAAPGAYSSVAKVGLVSTYPHDQYAALSGTSMSAPILSGAAALVVSWLKAYSYPVNPQRLEAILRESARRDPLLDSSIQGGRTLDLQSIAEFLKANYPRRGGD